MAEEEQPDLGPGFGDDFDSELCAVGIVDSIVDKAAAELQENFMRKVSLLNLASRKTFDTCRWPCHVGARLSATVWLQHLL